MLTLPIKGNWYDAVFAGTKKEEYREIKPYWEKRFQTIGLLNKEGLPTEDGTWVTFQNGYQKNARRFKAYVSILIKTGKPEWGAEPGREYYCLQIKAIGDK
jgi:acetyltransferase-like isoleucine patch superfamily enzyme